MITVEFPTKSRVQARFSALPDKVYAALVKKVTELSLIMEGRIKDKLSGPVLKVKTGDLRRSIHHEIDKQVNAVYGTVYSTGGRDNQPPYAAIHEFGGTINHPGGTPYFLDKSGQAIFISKAAAADMFATPPVTRPHTIEIPERSYMRSTAVEMRSDIVQGLKDALSEGVRTK